MEWISILLIFILMILGIGVVGIGLLILSVGWMDRM